jgi:tetratricopeptide (TPR) repeat protein
MRQIKLGLLLCFSLLLPVGAQSIPAGRLTRSSAHYVVESDLTDRATTQLINQLEAGFDLFIRYLPQQAALIKTPLKVRVFADYSAFLRAFSDFDPAMMLGTRLDFLFMMEGDGSEGGTLFIYPKEDSRHMASSLVKHSFLQMILSSVLTATPWVREGLAIYFETAQYDERTNKFTVPVNHTYLDNVQRLHASNPLTMEQLLNMSNEIFEGDLERGLTYSWALVNFLAQPDVQGLAPIIQALNAQSSESENMQVSAELAREFSAGFADYLASPRSFTTGMELGRIAFEQGRYAEADEWFTVAMVARPLAFEPVYFRGLIAFEAQQYEEAKNFYDKAQLLGADSALIQYNLGMVAYALEEFAEARRLFAIAATEDPMRFGRLVDRVLAQIDQAEQVQARRRY